MTENVLSSFDKNISDMMNIMNQSINPNNLNLMQKNAEINHFKNIGKLNKIKGEGSNEELKLLEKLDPELWEDTINIIDSVNNILIKDWRSKNIDWWVNILIEEVKLLDLFRKLEKELNKNKNFKIIIGNLAINILSLSILNNKIDMFYTSLLTGETLKNKFSQKDLKYKIQKEMILMSSLEVLDIVILKFVEIWFSMNLNINDFLMITRIISIIKFMDKKYSSWVINHNDKFDYVKKEMPEKIDINTYKNILQLLESRIQI